ncbi:2536_t:CDS:2, partial [Dentiscutata heterogama]
LTTEIGNIKAEIDNELTTKINSRDANYVSEAQNIITMINDMYEKYNEIKQDLVEFNIQILAQPSGSTLKKYLIKKGMQEILPLMKC